MLNVVILMGRLTRDPELRQTSSGISACRFSVAVDRSYASKTTGQRETDFINVMAWRAQADFVMRYFHKGSMIIVQGSLQNNNYTDSNGVKHYGYDVVANNISFGESKKASVSGGDSFNTGNYPQENYQQNNFPSGNSYQQPSSNIPPQSGDIPGAMPAMPSEGNAADVIGDMSSFEDLSSDGEVPF